MLPHPAPLHCCPSVAKANTKNKTTTVQCLCNTQIKPLPTPAPIISA